MKTIRQIKDEANRLYDENKREALIRLSKEVREKIKPSGTWEHLTDEELELEDNWNISANIVNVLTGYSDRKKIKE